MIIFHITIMHHDQLLSLNKLEIENSSVDLQTIQIQKWSTPHLLLPLTGCLFTFTDASEGFFGPTSVSVCWRVRPALSFHMTPQSPRMCRCANAGLIVFTCWPTFTIAFFFLNIFFSNFKTIVSTIHFLFWFFFSFLILCSSLLQA